VANESHTRDSAEQLLRAGEADAVAFGKLFIANPDLSAEASAKLATFHVGGRPARLHRLVRRSLDEGGLPRLAGPIITMDLRFTELTLATPVITFSVVALK